ncbi:toll-like receptor 13 isoform X2 [Armigeres subalbatus]
MANNRMRLLPRNSLLEFSNVQYLSLMNNPFRDFSPDLEIRPKMPPLKSLIALDMRYCRLQSFPPDFFHELSSLQYLFLAHNYISKLPAPLFYSLGKLVHLDMSYMDSNSHRDEEERVDNPFMRLIEGMDLDPNIFEPLKNLKFLDLSHTKMDLRAFMSMSSLGKNLEYVSYCYTELPALMDYLFLMESIKMMDLSGNVGCARLLNPSSFQLLRNTLEVLFFRNASIQQLDWITGLNKLRVLNLQGNFITSLEGARFRDLVSLEAFDVSNNFVQHWVNRVFQHNNNLEVLNVRNNNLLLISSNMLRDFEKIHFLAVGANQLQCSCNFVFLLHMVFGNVSNEKENCSKPFHKGNKRPNYAVGHVHLYDYNEEDYLCMNYTNKKKVNTINLTVCAHEDEGIYSNVVLPETIEELIEDYIAIYIISCVVAVIILGLALLIYWYWFYVKYFFVLVKNSAILSFFDDEKVYLDKSFLDEESAYQYDVFVSYSDNDRAWVLDEMLPTLEREDQIAVCLHERDFEVGYGILENIISCMDRSRCLMLIVSESFLLSRWCQFEMHLAQHRLLETRRDELILVLLEDIPRRKCPKTLRYLMKTKTYIKWPRQQTNDRELFWKRLRGALMSTKR